MAAVAEHLATLHPEEGRGYLRPDRSVLRSMFHAADVPADVIAAEAQHASVLPIRAAVRNAVGRSLRPFAATIDVPVFLAYGDVDISPEPRTEPSVFSATSDITLQLLRGSAHLP